MKIGTINKLLAKMDEHKGVWLSHDDDYWNHDDAETPSPAILYIYTEHCGREYLVCAQHGEDVTSWSIGTFKGTRSFRDVRTAVDWHDGDRLLEDEKYILNHAGKFDWNVVWELHNLNYMEWYAVQKQLYVQEMKAIIRRDSLSKSVNPDELVWVNDFDKEKK